jgi:Fe-S cluster assembly protein SufD
MTALPNRKLEDWKYSDLHNAIGEAAVSSAPTAVWSVASASGGVEVNDLPDIAPRGEHGVMAALALDAAKTGPYVRVPKGETGAIHLHLAEGGHGRAVIVVEDGASLELRESVLTDAFTNLAVEIVLGRDARLTHVREAPAEKTARVADYAVRVAQGAVYRAHLIDLGTKLSRTELHIALEGQGAQAHLSGASVLNDVHADVTTHVTHAHGNTQSTQLFKYVAGGHARGIYQGKVTVAQGANGSDSRQTAKGLLLQDRAEIDLKPELEILADDVKCAHGAAVGDLDAESLFYLRSRGLPEAEARALLMRAFLGDAVELIENESIRATVWNAVDAVLERMS